MKIGRLSLGWWCAACGWLLWGTSAIAQVVGDGTLPPGAQTQVTGNPNFQIDGGATRGSNLFHSFSQFSVPTGGSAFFNNALNITNILSRVTGNSISNIDGVIRANGSANVFLLNPNGILFGSNARLNIGGSFVGTTADEIGLANGDRFSANPTQPLPSQLLNVNPNAFLFNQLAAQAIVNRSSGIGLRVPAGRSLLLVGGDVRFEAGRIVSPGSQVELGGVAGQGTIALTGTGNDLRLSIPDGVARSDVSLINGSSVEVPSAGGGSIAIHARNLTLANDSRILAGIRASSGSIGTQAGDIMVDATDTVNLTNNSRIVNQVGSNAIGNAGNISITTGTLSILSESANLTAATFGRGNVGNVLINARDAVFLDGSDIFNSVTPRAIGQGGEIQINTGSLFLINGARLSATTSGQGNASNVVINARDTIFLNGRSTDGQFGSTIFSRVNQGAIGQGGEIRITTGSLSLTNGAQLTVSTRGQGNAGRVIINARDTITLDGIGSIGQFATAVFSAVNQGAIGQGGEIRITTGSLSLTNGATLTASTSGQGNAGSVIINARDTITLDGRSAANLPTAVFSTVNTGAIGQGGEIRITTGSLFLTNSARLVSGTSGQSDAGNIVIDARDTVSLSGRSPDGRFSSAISGNSNPIASGRGGTIRIKTGELALQDGAQVTVNGQGAGIAGDLEVTAQRIRLLNNGSLTAETASTTGGNITLNVGELLLLRNNSLISTTAGTAQAGGDGGNIRINGGFIVSVLSENNDIRANAFTGRGGNVSIAAQGIFGIRFVPQPTPNSDITASSEFGLSGVVAIDTPDIDPSRGTLELPTDLTDPARWWCRVVPPIAATPLSSPGGVACPPLQTRLWKMSGAGAIAGDLPKRETRPERWIVNPHRDRRPQSRQPLRRSLKPPTGESTPMELWS